MPTNEETLEAMHHDKEMETAWSGNAPIDKCRKIAAEALGVSVESTYVVMFSFVLGNFKALCSSSEMHDTHGHYIEVVFDGVKNRYYVVHYEESFRDIEFDTLEQ